jgi:hypothetical protein
VGFTSLSQLSPCREGLSGILADAGKWSGPALAALGLLGAAIIALLPVQSIFRWWIFSSVLAPERVLPLIGVGVALALVGFRYYVAALALFGSGIIVGFLAKDWLLSAFETIPQAANHQFLTAPICSVAVGFTLMLPSVRLRSWLLPFAAVVIGALLAVAIKITDPNVDDIVIPLTGAVIGIWIVVAISLTVRTFRRDWFWMPARILGSWLVAIGILYGGVSLAPKHNLPVLPPVAATPNAAPVPDFDHLPPHLGRLRNRLVPEISDAMPGGFEQP